MWERGWARQLDTARLFSPLGGIRTSYTSHAPGQQRTRMAGMAGMEGIRYHRRTDIDVKPVICSGKILSGGVYRCDGCQCVAVYCQISDGVIATHTRIARSSRMGSMGRGSAKWGFVCLAETQGAPSSRWLAGSRSRCNRFVRERLEGGAVIPNRVIGLLRATGSKGDATLEQQQQQQQSGNYPFRSATSDPLQFFDRPRPTRSPLRPLAMTFSTAPRCSRAAQQHEPH